MMMGMVEDPENPAAVAGSIFIAVAVSISQSLPFDIPLSFVYRYTRASWYSADSKRG